MFQRRRPLQARGATGMEPTGTARDIRTGAADAHLCTPTLRTRRIPRILTSMPWITS